VRYDLPRFIHLPNSTFLASPIPDIWKSWKLEEGLKFKIWALDPDHALLGVFCHGWDGTCL